MRRKYHLTTLCPNRNTSECTPNVQWLYSSCYQSTLRLLVNKHRQARFDKTKICPQCQFSLKDKVDRYEPKNTHE